jgi:hypothetical protein
MTSTESTNVPRFDPGETIPSSWPLELQRREKKINKLKEQIQSLEVEKEKKMGTYKQKRLKMNNKYDLTGDDLTLKIREKQLQELDEKQQQKVREVEQKIHILFEKLQKVEKGQKSEEET